jgi:hypothetical protein
VRRSSIPRFQRRTCRTIALTSPYPLPSLRERRGKTAVRLSPHSRSAQKDYEHEDDDEDEDEDEVEVEVEVEVEDEDELFSGLNSPDLSSSA